MPRCKYCKQMLSSLDKDICPFCGGVKPFQGQNNETDDITQALDPISNDFDNYKTKSRKVVIALFALFGFTGAPMFYLKKPRKGLFLILNTILLIAGCGSILFFLVPGLKNIWGYLIPIIALFFQDIIFSMVYLFNHNLKDGTGEYLQ